MSCSKEDIETKRLAALERKRLRTNLKLHDGDASMYRNSPQAVNSNISSQYNVPKQRFEPYKNVAKDTRPLNSSFSLPTKVVSGTAYLISENRFEVKPSHFSEQLINVFKSIKSRIYGESLYLYCNIQSLLCMCTLNLLFKKYLLQMESHGYGIFL